MTDATLRPTAPMSLAGKRFTLRRAVLVGAAAGILLVAAALALLPDRIATTAETAKAPAQLSTDSLPPPIFGRRESAGSPELSGPLVATGEPAPGQPSASRTPSAVSPDRSMAEAPAAAVPAAARPAIPPPAEAAPVATAAEGSRAPGSPVALASARSVAQSPDPVPGAMPAVQLLGGAAVAPPDSDWAAVDGTLGCPSAARGSVMDLLCRLNAQTLAREYQLKLMEQNARKAEIAARQAQADATRADAQRRQRTGQPIETLPPADARSTVPAAPAGPTISAIRGQGGSWTAILRLADGSNATVRTGQELPGGLRVQRIDRDGVSVRGPGGSGERRLAFATSPVPGADDAQALPRLPAPRP